PALTATHRGPAPARRRPFLFAGRDAAADPPRGTLRARPRRHRRDRAEGVARPLRRRRAGGFDAPAETARGGTFGKGRARAARARYGGSGPRSRLARWRGKSHPVLGLAGLP